MSVETLVLFALFVLLPLVERLIRSARQRQQTPRAPARIPPQSPSRSATHQPPHDAPIPDSPPLRADLGDLLLLDEAPVHPIAPAARQRGRVVSDAGVRRPRRDRLLGRPSSLRRAVVLMTVLEPCQGLEDREIPVPRAGRHATR